MNKGVEGEVKIKVGQKMKEEEEKSTLVQA